MHARSGIISVVQICSTKFRSLISFRIYVLKEIYFEVFKNTVEFRANIAKRVVAFFSGLHYDTVCLPCPCCFELRS